MSIYVTPETVRFTMKPGFVSEVQLRALMVELAPHHVSVLDRWVEAFRQAVGDQATLTPEEVREHTKEELAALLEFSQGGTIDALWTRLEQIGRRHAESGVAYGELAILLGLFEESATAELAAHGADCGRQLAAYRVFDRMSHVRTARLVEAYARALAEERDRHEMDLMRAEKLTGLGNLAGGVAHELNNPLATISITVEDLQDALRIEAKSVNKSWPELAPALERIRSSVTRCIGIIGGMLDLARHRPPSNGDFRVNELMSKVADVSSLASRSRAKKIVLDLAPDLDWARSDSRQLEQVLMALVSNALDAIEPAGTVTLRTRRLGEFFAIEVVDDGCGIPPEHRERIFEPFFTTKPPGKGTGLGLSMAYSAVKRLDGRLTVESEAGQGTVARVMLPLVNTRLG